MRFHMSQTPAAWKRMDSPGDKKREAKAGLEGRQEEQQVALWTEVPNGENINKIPKACCEPEGVDVQ